MYFELKITGFEIEMKYFITIVISNIHSFDIIISLKSRNSIISILISFTSKSFSILFYEINNVFENNDISIS